MAKTVITARVLSPKVAVPKKKSIIKIIQKKPRKNLPLKITRVTSDKSGNGPKAPRKTLKVDKKPVKAAKTDQKGPKANKIEA
jgi:hypothetical protein